MLWGFVSVYIYLQIIHISDLSLNWKRKSYVWFQNLLEKNRFVVLEVIPAYVWLVILYIPVLKRSIQEMERLGPDHYFLIKI